MPNAVMLSSISGSHMGSLSFDSRLMGLQPKKARSFVLMFSTSSLCLKNRRQPPPTSLPFTIHNYPPTLCYITCSAEKAFFKWQNNFYNVIIEIRIHKTQTDKNALRQELIWQSEDRASWYILIMKANEMHYFSDLFDEVLYMFRTGPLYTRNGCLLAWSSWPR
jgi:hypothetical protein